jgi:hypothetical protein
MNKEIKIIDLLNMIVEGKEVPKKIKYIKYNYEAYTYNNDDKDYISDVGNYGLFATTTVTHILNDTVEIIEEDKKIPEKLKSLNNVGNSSDIGEFKDKQQLNNHLIKDKLNEGIDYLDYLKSKGE